MYTETSTSREADFDFQDEGSIAILIPRTALAQDWTADNIGAETIWWGGGFVIEHRYVGVIIDGIQAEGLTIAC